MKKLEPEKNFIPISRGATCKYMKMITIEKVLKTLENELPEVRVPAKIATKARSAIDKMISIG